MTVLNRMKQLMLLVGDLISFAIGLWISIALRHTSIPLLEQYTRHLPLFVVVFGMWIVINYINELYSVSSFKTKRIYYTTFIQAGIVSLLIGIIFFYIVPSGSITPKTILVLTVLIGYGLSWIWRIGFSQLARTKHLSKKIIFVGCNNEVEELVLYLQKNPEVGYKVAAIIDPDKKIHSHDLDCEVFRGPHTLRPLVKTKHADMVIMTSEAKLNPQLLQELYELLFWNTPLVDLTSFYETITGRIPPSSFSESWFLDHLSGRGQPIYEKISWILDKLAAILIGIFFVIAFPFIAAAIRINSPGPVLLKQKRTGKYGKPFTMYKFRSMYALNKDGSAEKEGVATFAQKKDKRITNVGKILRKTRLDELPQVINILKGDMNLIGPRPERPQLVEQLQEKMPYYHLRHLIKPGVTGWTALKLNYTDTIESSLKKIEYDLYYIKNKSLLLDLSIVLKTINMVMRFRGQ